jgi:hypothetical protein
MAKSVPFLYLGQEWGISVVPFMQVPLSQWVLLASDVLVLFVTLSQGWYQKKNGGAACSEMYDC